ncbi:HAD-superfamily hydrolase, subfamily IIA [Dillenia turbinata]|uniref:HAD-superfamily hydrolase, subfamily IIA n=1 Tax=Dillenia turbinata TaxID=194707 RepID=A0AAN8VP97_9MAGN
MRFRSTWVCGSYARVKPPLLSSLAPQASHSYSHLRSNAQCSSFGIAFDIDGVVLRGRVPIGGSPQALKRLYRDCGTLKVPFLFLTNGGGIPESKRALELSELFGVHIVPAQVVQGHSPFKNFAKRFENELVVATGKGDPALVMTEYGFKKAISVDEYASYFDHIDPVSQYKRWTTKLASEDNDKQTELVPRFNVLADRVKAAFVISDPVDWGRDIQVLCDILRSGGLPGQRNGGQPPLYIAADDLEYQAAFPCERLGMGAFRIALQSVFNRIHDNALEYTSFGKPNPFVFRNAEMILKQLQLYSDHHEKLIPSNGHGEAHSFKTLYMVGDNPAVDIKGARKAGDTWFSILTRTGVFKGKDNHSEYPADLVVDTVAEAVDYILKKELVC